MDRFVNSSEVIPVLENRVFDPSSVKFDANYTFQPFLVDADTTLVIDPEAAKDGAQLLVEFVGDGVHVLSLGLIKNIGDDFDNSENTSNKAVIFKYGSSYFIKFFDVDILDVISPILQSAVVSSDNKKRIKLLYNENLDNSFVPLLSDFAVSGSITGIATVTAVSISGGYVYVDCLTDFDPTENISCSYSGNDVRDVSGNLAANFTDYNVANNINVVVNINWSQVESGTITGNSVFFSATTGKAIANQKIAAGTLGYFQWRFTTVSETTQAMCGLSTTPGLQAWDSFTYVAYQAPLLYSPAGASTGYTVLAGDYCRFNIVSNGANRDLLLQTSNDGVNWTTRKTYASIANVDLYIKAGTNIANKNIYDAKGFNLTTF